MPSASMFRDAQMSSDGFGLISWYPEKCRVVHWMGDEDQAFLEAITESPSGSSGDMSVEEKTTSRADNPSHANSIWPVVIS